jgi:hypothetical protein
VSQQHRRSLNVKDACFGSIRIVLEGLRGEESIAELCPREGIVQNLYYRWSKDFLGAGKKRLAGDTARAGLNMNKSNAFDSGTSVPPNIVIDGERPEGFEDMQRIVQADDARPRSLGALAAVAPRAITNLVSIAAISRSSHHRHCSIS